jgi:hypothetical protein
VPILTCCDESAMLAIKTLGTGFDPANYTFHGGTEGTDDFTGQATVGPDVFCGFGGDDGIDTLDAGDVFLSGDGNDQVRYTYGTFYGEAGNDSVGLNRGTFVQD